MLGSEATLRRANYTDELQLAHPVVYKVWLAAEAPVAFPLPAATI